MIVQEGVPPTGIDTLAQPVWFEVYPVGTGDSVAVHVAPALNPLTVVVNADASDAGPDAGEGVPLVHDTLTLTDAALFGTKSLCTVSVAVLSVFVIVHEGVPPGVSRTPAQEA